MHIGVDTVHLEGVFEPMVKPGQRVAAGQLLCRADFKKIRAAGLCESVILLITEKTVPGEVKIQKGIVRGGKDVALYLKD